ncbi:uncharacterized protein si:ch73-52p7.1 [Cololabis saira]|uniref:uncharacterized protein si:ch73-52p7.1 n=1 Tax=Cololabis saira TaxID=129043 RepID=UPI002AD496B9|nr:uncharacterized protein si:ch73-52p7.1 [Cololabis saira]
MPGFSPPALFLFVLLCVSAAQQRSDLAYVTHSSFSYFSCSQDPHPCSISSLTTCRCKDMQLSTLHHPHSQLTPVFWTKQLTVWFTSPSNVARLLNNSEVKHLTLVHCGGARGPPSFSLEGHFVMKHLERLTVLNLQEKPFHLYPEAIRVKSTSSNTNLDRDNGFHLHTRRYNRERDTNMDLDADAMRLPWSSTQIQDIFLGRELGAAYHEQARLGIIHCSVLDWGAVIKAYTVQTHIDSDGKLPFPDLHLPKLPEASVIYVSFVY